MVKGGYIVGKTAQIIYYGGEDLGCISDWREAEAKTKALIKERENVIIYEAIVACNGKLVLIDILEKKGNALHPIEVKAKSQDSTSIKEDKTMMSYVEDVLYQVITTEEA